MATDDEASGRRADRGDFSFGRDCRILKRAEFQRAYRDGRRVGGAFFLCFFRRRPDGDGAGDPSRIGITVTRKVGKAVRRNRARRLVREFFRLRRARVSRGFDIVVNVRPQAVGAETKKLWRDLERIFEKAGVMKRNRSAASPEKSTGPDRVS